MRWRMFLEPSNLINLFFNLQWFEVIKFWLMRLKLGDNFIFDLCLWLIFRYNTLLSLRCKRTTRPPRSPIAKKFPLWSNSTDEIISARWVNRCVKTNLRALLQCQLWNLQKLVEISIHNLKSCRLVTFVGKKISKLSNWKKFICSTNRNPDFSLDVSKKYSEQVFSWKIQVFTIDNS